MRILTPTSSKAEAVGGSARCRTALDLAQAAYDVAKHNRHSCVASPRPQLSCSNVKLVKTFAAVADSFVCT